MNTTIIQIGTRVYTNLYGRGYGSIYAIHGEQMPQTVRSLLGGAMVTGGRATFDIVFDDGSLSLHLPESILRGVQWQICDDESLASPLQISDALNKAEQAKTAKELAEVERQMMLEKCRRDHAAKFAHLTTATDKMGGAKLGAVNIRKELKAAFPGIKFSVTSDGSSIRISWLFGPTAKAVEAITDKYQQGSFDGMQDLYEYDRNDVFTPVYGGARWVNTSHNFAEEVFQQLCREYCALNEIEYRNGYDERDGHEYISSIVRRILEKVSLAPTAQIIGLTRKHGEGTGRTEDFYRLRLSTDKSTPAKPRYRFDHSIGQLQPVA